MIVRTASINMALTAVIAAVTATPSRAQEFHVDIDRPNEAKFVAETNLADIEGTTERIDGFAFWPSGELIEGSDYEGSEFYFEVELNALDTGINLRNRHMRERFLESDNFPYSIYSGAIDSVHTLAATSWTVYSSGTFTIHGVEKPTAISCPVSRAGEGFHVRCNFDVLLSDHEIPIPSFMGIAVKDLVHVELDFYLTPAE
ncbi:MAG: YceI family protein [Gemmatimonadota bacterium]|nr:YceI family protein [Gemmatimonadota bacterium]MDH5803534.1 YceI family protein [Gemmatimonadota bacterium]